MSLSFLEIAVSIFFTLSFWRFCTELRTLPFSDEESSQTPSTEYLEPAIDNSSDQPPPPPTENIQIQIQMPALPPPLSRRDHGPNNGFTTGAIIGITLGICAILILMLGFYYKRRAILSICGLQRRPASPEQHLQQRQQVAMIERGRPDSALDWLERDFMGRVGTRTETPGNRSRSRSGSGTATVSSTRTMVAYFDGYVPAAAPSVAR
ncbi:hypothetical protein K402DRAFT_466248 [Aulographum hederae CBS 113979]|uniref:Uncharacterized protein n=1 Tax=Aulographum hederae CBS 113979 TaxID=1176131 RepID=A0A6G1GR04_9PEZI|nr:hypothetical protein K402DRAFT_466248 [Aulographum hederae CBS 113979]